MRQFIYSLWKHFLLAVRALHAAARHSSPGKNSSGTADA